MIKSSSLQKVYEKKQKDRKDIVSNRNDIEISLEDVKNYLQENKHLLLQDKNKFTAETLMMLLDNDKLAALEDEFNEHPNGIELSNFVWLMKCAIVHSQEEKYELINGLIKLFQDIDINGDHHMEWSEFTQYIIDAVIGEKDAKFFDARFERERELTEIEVFDRAYSKKTKRYFPCKYFDNTTHMNHIRKAVYSPHVDAILCLEQNSSKLKFYTHDCKEVEIQQKKLQLQPPADDKQQPFILDFTVAESLNTIVVTTSDRQFFFWENNLTTKCTKNFKLDVLQTGIWYLPIHKLWISAGADYNIRTWKFNDYEDQQKINHDKLMLAHLKLITQIEELISPRLIASGSLDGKIKLWDLTDPSNPPILITELRDPNQNPRGILGLSYSCQYGSNLLSYGFENHINVWCPEVSITRAFIGKLEGHSSLVQICKFMDMSPNVISVDDKCNVRIWDIRGMNTIQVINSDGQFSVIYDVAILSQKHDMFVLAGKRLAYYENVVYKEQAKNTSEDVYPLSIDFNTYFNQFCVLTKNDIRIYDAMTGKLKKVFNDLTDEKFQVDLSYFCLGARQRKFFVSDNVGLIRQYNMKNGEYLKSCNTLTETESQEFTKKQSNIKKKENNQISQMLYLTEEKLLIAAFYDSTIRIYDEEDSEETVLLKVMTGAHKDSEITCLVYSEKFQLFATGSTNGRVAIWDFDSGKLENILIAREKGEITCLQFGDPYPVILSSGASGVINVWGIKGCPPQYKYKSIARYINSYWENDNTFQKVPVTYMICETSIQSGVPRPFIIDKIAPVQRSSFDPVMKDEKKDDAQNKRKKDLFNFSLNTQTINSNTNGPLTSTNNAGNTLTFPTETGYVAPISPNPKEGDDTNANESSSQQQQLMSQFKFQESFNDYQSYFDSYNKTLDQKKRRFYVIFGDQKGMMQILNLTEVFQKRNIQPLKDEKKKKLFQLRRKDFINAQKSVDTYLSAPDRKGEKLPSYVHMYNSILINRWEAHQGPINFMLRIPEPLCYASCSLDKTIKIWSMQAALWGKIFLMKFDKNVWNFPYDWVENKLKDMEEVFDQIQMLDNEVLSNQEKEKVKMKYLSTQFFQEGTQEDIKTKKYNVLYPPKQLTQEELLQIEKQELYTYRLKPKPYVDPIQQLRSQIQEEDEKARFQKKKNEPFLKVKPIEEDLTPIKMFYKIIPNDRPNSSYQQVSQLQNQLEAIEQGLTGASLELKQENQQSRKASNMVSEQRDSYQNLPRQQYKNRSSSRFINKSMKGNQSNININNTASQSQINKKSFAQEQKISAFISKQKSSIIKQGNSLPSASLTSLVKPNALQKKSNDIYKKFDFRVIRPSSSSMKISYVKDVKYSKGEGSRLVRIATDQYTYQQASLAPLKFFKDLDLVQDKNKFYIDLVQNYDGRAKKDLSKLNVGGDNELNYDSDDSDKKPKKKTGSVKIVATSTFLNNPNRNKHKVLKTGEKIYVIEQDG